MCREECATVNNIGKIGLDDTGMRVGPGSEKMRLTELAEPSGRDRMVVSRQKVVRSAYERRTNSKKISTLLVCAAAIIIVSAIAVAAFGGVKVEKARIGAPGQPFAIFGYTKDAASAVVPFAHVNISDSRSHYYTNVISNGVGLYSQSIATWDWEIGDTIVVVANTTTLIGTNSGVIGSVNPYLQIDVTLTVAAIPEFTDIVIPIVGMVSIFAVARVASSRSEEE
jgi:hypothetical protein